MTLFDLDVSLVLFDCAEDESEKEATLSELAYVVRAYFHGVGHIEQKRGLFRPRWSFTVTVNDREWKVGRRAAQSIPIESVDARTCRGRKSSVRARRW